MFSTRSTRFSPLGFALFAALAAVTVLESAACGSDDGATAQASDGTVPPVATDSGKVTPLPTSTSTSSTDAAPPPPKDAGRDAPSDAPLDTAPKPPFACTADGAFPGILSVPEASSAAEVELKPGVRELLVMSDSGNGGKALLIAIPSGTQRSITLTLDTGANDDIEGIAWRSGKLYTLTSSGAVRRFAPDGAGGLVRDQDAYRLGADPYSCADLQAVNCGKNYEGLCLRAPTSTNPCVGYAAAKAEGKLYCLTMDAGGKLAASTTVSPLNLNLPADQLSDCAFGAAGGSAADVLAVTTNVFGLSKTYRVNEATGALTKLPIGSLLNVEATAIDKDGSLYVFDDNSTSTSTSAKMTCVGW